MDSEEMDYPIGSSPITPILEFLSNPEIPSNPVDFTSFSRILDCFLLTLLVYGLFDNTAVAIVLIFLQKQKQKLNNSTNVFFLKKQRLNW